MSGGQVAALIFAILLLLPGGCFLIAGIAVATDRQFHAEDAFIVLSIAAALLGLSIFLLGVAFRRRRFGQSNTPPNPPAGSVS